GTTWAGVFVAGICAGVVAPAPGSVAVTLPLSPADGFEPPSRNPLQDRVDSAASAMTATVPRMFFRIDMAWSSLGLEEDKVLEERDHVLLRRRRVRREVVSRRLRLAAVLQDRLGQGDRAP